MIRKLPESDGSNAEIFSVSDLNKAAKSLLEGHFPMVFVEGEISNFSVPASGHWYLTLKDEGGQLRTAMFRNRNQRVRFKPRNGLKVLIRGKISLYEARGEYQFIAEHMEEAGEGELRRAFEQLKQRLQADGLFDEARKRALPGLPKHLAIITSPTGAAIRDVLSVLKRRFPALNCTIIPSQVQGEEATAQVVAALALANAFDNPDFDAILLTRGGGSLEDLWTFNTEPVALAIANSRIPVVSAIGHESDFTIADFVADIRAATPSAAAEILAPDQTDWMQQFDGLAQRLTRAQSNHLRAAQAAVQSLTRRLRNPSQTLTQMSERLERLQPRLLTAVKRALDHPEIDRLEKQLQTGVEQQLKQAQTRLSSASARQTELMQRQLIDERSNLQRLAGQLNALSPLAVMDRGFSLVRNEQQGLISRAAQLQADQTITIDFADGRADAIIQNKPTLKVEGAP
ncbi:MAG: exodeoxyribonuclease VII large subunit [Candidatus Azotimanducaceae bacterium]|jgi:exodeoxyribonuclease VII large subunit